jgi:hypothetical protein
LRHSATEPQEQTYYHDSDDDDDDYKHDPNFERALQESIKSSSKGDTEEDKAIDKAIRASIAHLQQQVAKQGANAADDDDAEDEQLKLAIAESLKNDQESGVLRPPPAIPPRSPHRSASPLPPVAKEVNFTEPGGSSLVADAQTAAAVSSGHDKDLRKALEESQKMGDEEDRARREEEIVLEYVKKQSLMEENYRRSLGQGGASGEGSGTG